MTEAPASPKKFSPAIAIAILVLLMAVVLRVHSSWKAERQVLAEITLKGKTFTVEVADTNQKREKGLGDRDRLEDGHGMYFPFDTAQYWVFWMKDMRFPIDIIWIREGKIVDIDASVPVAASEKLETYSPSEPADTVLELNAGTAADLGLVPGDALTIKAL